MAQTDEFGEELVDFVRRVAALKAARSVSEGDLPTVLDAAIFELDHVADQLWPWYERLSSGGQPRTTSAERQEQHLLRGVFQRFPLAVVLVDREAVVRRLNFAATSFTGVRAGYATGRPLTGFLAHADRVAFRSQAAAVATAASPCTSSSARPSRSTRPWPPYARAGNRTPRCWWCCSPAITGHPAHRLPPPRRRLRLPTSPRPPGTRP
jgi:PAS domain-containing protein